ncbi:MAG: hypothetical protein HY748_16295 [Elusimicrobia bacterium]|nr:hypothetical protein [Elusimicrobiota bacterium]
MNALERFAEWLANHRHRDPKYGHVYKYHSRSDAHSIALCTLVAEDILSICPSLREQASAGRIAFGINIGHIWPNGKKKTIDLAIGRPQQLDPEGSPIKGFPKAAELSEVFISCEAKTVMTEHKKSQPRIFDELGSSHEIVHQGRPDAIAVGITMVNIADRFASPLRQKSRKNIFFLDHRQPDVAASMIQHLQGLPIRDAVGQAGFDAYCTFVVNTDNIGGVSLWTASPAPQPGEKDHYQTAIGRVTRFYSERFGSV